MARIYISIYNGIGNQLFSYALGLYLSKKYHRQLILDLSKLTMINFLSGIKLKKDTIRNFEIDKIGFTDPVVKFNYLQFMRKQNWIHENKKLFFDFRKNHFDLIKVNSNADLYCTGWGDFNLVKEILPEMRAKFSPNFKITKNFEATRKLIREKNSVAIHFRRTDFLDPKVSEYAIGISNDKYYQNAIQLINKKVENPFYILFSDDIDYVKENFKIENCYVVEGNTGYEDLYLMSLCKHFILANSTFSFWAAIFNDKNDKVVCVPEYWYNAPLRQADFIPEEWTEIAIM